MNKIVKVVVLSVSFSALAVAASQAGGITLPKEMVEAAQHETPRIIDLDSSDESSGGDVKLILPKEMVEAAQDKPTLKFPKEMVEDAKKKPTLKFPKDMVEGAQKKGKPGSGQTLDVAISCEVAGTAEFSDDLVLINRGAPLGAGTTIQWKVKSAGQGFVRLNSDLPAGGSVRAKDVLGEGVEAGKPCAAKIV